MHRKEASLPCLTDRQDLDAIEPDRLAKMKREHLAKILMHDLGIEGDRTLEIIVSWLERVETELLDQVTYELKLRLDDMKNERKIHGNEEGDS